MYKNTLRSSRSAFTLIELLTVIAIIGILASILFPAISAAKRAAQKSADLSNIRSIGQAALIYANTNNDALPDPIANKATPVVTSSGNLYMDWFGLLASGGELNTPAVLVSKLDPLYNAATVTTITILQTPATTPPSVSANFANNFVPSYEVVGGITASASSTTPIAYTRGLGNNGQWTVAAPVAPYGTEGGMIVFVGGNVSQYKAINKTLTNTGGTTTSDITHTVLASGNAAFYGPGGANSVIGTPGGTLSTATTSTTN